MAKGHSVADGSVFARPTFRKPATGAPSAEEQNVLMVRIATLLEENNRLLRELAATRAERDALERALHALKRKRHEAG